MFDSRPGLVCLECCVNGWRELWSNPPQYETTGISDKLFLVPDSPLCLLVFARNVINNSSDTTLYGTKIDQIFFSVFKINVPVYFLPVFVIG